MPNVQWNMKQQTFVLEFMKDFNATQAAIRAGYAASTAGQEAYLMLQEPEVCAVLKAELDKRTERCRIDADNVLKELALVAFTTIGDYVSWQDGKILLNNSSDLTEKQLRGVQSIRATTTGIELKMYDKVKSLELLARHLGMLDDRLRVEGVGRVIITGADELE